MVRLTSADYDTCAYKSPPLRLADLISLSSLVELRTISPNDIIITTMFLKYFLIIPFAELVVYDTFRARFSHYYGGQSSASIFEKVVLTSPFRFMAFLNSADKFGVAAPVFIPSATVPVYVPPSPVIDMLPHPGMRLSSSNGEIFSAIFNPSPNVVAYTGITAAMGTCLLLTLLVVMSGFLTITGPRYGHALLTLGSRILDIMAFVNNCYDFVVEELQANLWNRTYQVGHQILTRLKQARKQFSYLSRDNLPIAYLIADTFYVSEVLVSAFDFIESLEGAIVVNFYRAFILLVLSLDFVGQVLYLPPADSIVRGARRCSNYLTLVWKSALAGPAVILYGTKATTNLDDQDLNKAFDLATSLDSCIKHFVEHIASENHSGGLESVEYINPIVKGFNFSDVSEHPVGEGAVQDNAIRDTVALSPRFNRSTGKRVDMLSKVKGLPLVVVPELALPFDLCHDDTVDLAEYHVLEPLGQGAYGSVVKAIHRKTGRVIAVKRIPDKDCWGDISVGVLEFNSMKRIKNLEKGGEWFPSLYAFAMEGEEFVIAMTFYPCGTLAELINAHGGIDRVRSTYYSAELIVAIHIIHQEGIIHQDIKPSNILIDHDGHLVLADFGCAMTFDLPNDGDKEGKRLRDLDKKLLGDRFPRLWATWDNHDVVTQLTRVGTDMFAAPEIFRFQDYSYGVDYFAMGVTFFCMLTGRGPYDVADTVMDVVDLKARYLDYQTLTNDEIHFLLGVLQPSQFERPDLTQMKSHKIFSEINWKALEKRQVPVPPVVRLTLEDLNRTTDIEDDFAMI